MPTRPNRKSAHSFIKACLQAFLIISAATAIGLLINAFRPHGLELIRPGKTASPQVVPGSHEGPQPIEPSEALEMLEKGDALFIDARSKSDYNAGHIKTARNLEEKTLDAWMPDFFNNTPPETPLVVYCSTPRCHLAERLATKLYEFGYTDARVLTAGWNAWQANGYPVEAGPTFTSSQSLNQATDCSSGECSDAQASPAGPAQSN